MAPSGVSALRWPAPSAHNKGAWSSERKDVCSLLQMHAKPAAYLSNPLRSSSSLSIHREARLTPLSVPAFMAPAVMQPIRPGEERPLATRAYRRPVKSELDELLAHVSE